MDCPACHAENDDSAEVCFNCRAVVSAVTRGTVIGSRYEVLTCLGRGGMGVVYKATDRVLEETVAIKLLRSDVAREADLARRFRSEIKLARRVTHRNVCRIHEYGEDGPLRFISMEYVEGTDLKKVVRETGPLAPDVAFEAVIQAARGLEAIHEVGIIHRDLKTTNIMRDGRGVVRLMDFGIAKQTGADATGATATGQIMGTPEYMSPEQARGLKADLRSDVYSLGVVIYELFTGGVPFKGDTPVATLFMQVQEAPPLEGPAGERLPRELLPVLRRALAKDPDDRYPSARELCEALLQARVAWESADVTVVPGATVGASGPRAVEAVPLGTPPPTRAPGGPGASPDAPTEIATAVLETRVRPRPAVRPPRAAPASRRPERTRSRVASIIAGAAAVVLVAASWASWMRSREASAPPLPLASESAVPPAAVPMTTVTTADTGPPVPERGPVESRSTRETGAGSRLSTPTTASGAPAARTPILRVSAPPPPVVPRPAATPAPSAGPAERAPAVAASVPSIPPATVAASSTPGPAPAAPAATPVPVEERGFVQIMVVPFAEATIDGVAVGRVSSSKLPLKVGSHTVVLSHPEYQPLQRRVTVVPGETVRLIVDLSEEAIRKKK